MFISILTSYFDHYSRRHLLQHLPNVFIVNFSRLERVLIICTHVVTWRDAPKIYIRPSVCIFSIVLFQHQSHAVICFLNEVSYFQLAYAIELLKVGKCVLYFDNVLWKVRLRHYYMTNVYMWDFIYFFLYHILYPYFYLVLYPSLLYQAYE